jgi:hypothetical protein
MLNQFPTNSSAARTEDIKQELLTDMCQKLAVIGVDLIKNQFITRDIFSRAQQSGDYLSVIYQSVQENTNDFQLSSLKTEFFIKELKTPDLRSTNSSYASLTIVPSVIHKIHTSTTATIKNFQAYYYHRHAAQLIRVHVRPCITCAFAGKYDIPKVVPSADRTLQPHTSQTIPIL